ncbi:MAG TPA: acyl-CoA dehydrogenase family protein [Acidimicrobiia bacterium]
MSDEVVESEELRIYRLRAREWLADTMRPGDTEALDGESRPEHVARARVLQREVFDAGYAGITYPTEYGGQGLTLDHERVFLEEATGYEMPTLVFAVSLNILGPTLVAFGTHEQKAAHVRKMLAGEEIWLQLLSEPSGGSDLAGLLTRATHDGDSYILNGQKIWSTGALDADFCLCPARTRWDVPKHKGITIFIVPLSAPGVEIRPIKQIDEGAEFCQEFLTDVVVPAGNVVGVENEGWRVARGLLEIEHAWVGRSGGGLPRPVGVEGLVALARRRGLAGDVGMRRAIAAAYANLRVHSWVARRVSNGMAAGKIKPGYGSILKLGSDINIQREAELGLTLAGTAGVAWRPGDAEAADPAMTFLGSRSASIGGGTDEIQRNNASERGLGLPREPSMDRDLPFNEVPHN